MNKKQLDCLLSILNFCLELSEYKDSLTDIESNSVFAGIELVDSKCNLSLFGSPCMDGIGTIELDLNNSWDDNLYRIETAIRDWE